MPRVKIFPMDIDVIVRRINRVNERRVRAIHRSVSMEHVKAIAANVFPVGPAKHVRTMSMNVKVNRVRIKAAVM